MQDTRLSCLESKLGFYENGLERAAAVCVGVGSVAFGALPPGTIEAGVGLAGLAGFVLGRSAKFGPECARVRRSIQNQVLKDYRSKLQSEGETWQANADLEAAHSALLECLEGCVIDRQKLVASAVTPAGFPDEAVKVILRGLGDVRPDLFGADKNETLAYQYARDVVRAGITEVVENANYYRQLEPKLMFEMASALGEVRDEVKHVRLTVDEIRDEYKRELETAQKTLHARETDLVSLLRYILNRHVPQDKILPALEQSYEELTELRDNWSNLASLANEEPELAPLLAAADEAMQSGAAFSLENADWALAEADAKFEELNREREDRFKRGEENRAHILGKRANIAALKFDYAAAVELLNQQVDCFIKAFGEEHPDTANSYNNVAYNLDDQGRFTEAEPVYRKGLEIRERVLGEEHPDTASSYNNVAYNLNAQGRFSEAEPLFRKGLEICERVLGEEHPDTATSYNNVASNLNAQGRFSEAEPLYRKGLEIRERVLGEEHPDTATSYNNVAYNLNAQGRFSEAEPLYRKGLEISERVLGEEHPDTAGSYNNVASNLNAQGRFSEAEPLLRKALKISERVLGEEHPNTLVFRSNLEQILENQGKLE